MIIIDNNFDDEKIESIINERVKYLREKGSEYGWKEFKKDKKHYNYKEMTKASHVKNENYNETEGNYWKDNKYSDNIVRKKGYEMDYNYNKPYPYDQSYDKHSYYKKPSYYDKSSYYDNTYNQKYNKQKPLYYKKHYQKTDIFQVAMNDEKRRQEEAKAKEILLQEEILNHQEKDLPEIIQNELKLSNLSLTINPQIDKPNENLKSNHLIYLDVVNLSVSQIVNQSFTIEPEVTFRPSQSESIRISEDDSTLSKEQSFNEQDKNYDLENRQRQFKSDIHNPSFGSSLPRYEPQQPITNPYYNYPPPFMYGPSNPNISSNNYPPGYYHQDKNLNPNLQPTMEQMAHMYYYYQQMMMQQYQMNQMFNHNYLNPIMKNNIFKK